MGIQADDLRSFLEEKYLKYNQPAFIESDPIQVPHEFSRKEDIEIAGFFSATIAWGQRTTIINNARKLMMWMDQSPYEFVLEASEDELATFENFRHRTFNGEDCRYFLKAIRYLYKEHGGLEHAFQAPQPLSGISHFRQLFFALPHEKRTQKHVSDPQRGSSAKRLNMFLRWMVRRDGAGVDFGLWKDWDPANLRLPLDVHTGNVARKLGLLQRKQNDWKAVEELTGSLRLMDPEDPVKYDYALFGLGAFEKF